MPKDPWAEFTKLAIRLGWLERELRSGSISPADKAAFAEEIRRVSAERDLAVAVLGESAGKNVLQRTSRFKEPDRIVGF